MRAWHGAGLIVALAAGCASSAPAGQPPAQAETAAASKQPDASLESECDTLIEPINRALSDIQQLSKGRSTANETRGDLEKIAALYRRLDALLAKLRFEYQQLQSFAIEYQVMIRKAEKALTALLRAVDAKNPEVIEEVQADFEAAVRHEDDLVDRINAFCTDPASSRSRA